MKTDRKHSYSLPENTVTENLVLKLTFLRRNVVDDILTNDLFREREGIWQRLIYKKRIAG